MGATLRVLTPPTLAWLDRLAQEADVDIGINATSNGRHRDAGHYRGTAVDIGYLNNCDIGRADSTYAGMQELALRVQRAAARLGGLQTTGNLGPAGRFSGTEGPLPIANKDLRDAHKNHIHLSLKP